MPVHCPKCGREVSLNRLKNLIKRMFGSAALAIILFTSCSRYEDLHWDRMMKARRDIISTRVTDIRAVAEDFYFCKKRFWLLDLTQDWKWRKPRYWFMNLPYVADPFLNYPDYRAEILNSREYELDKDDQTIQSQCRSVCDATGGHRVALRHLLFSSRTFLHRD